MIPALPLAIADNRNVPIYSLSVHGAVCRMVSEEWTVIPQIWKKNSILHCIKRRMQEPSLTFKHFNCRETNKSENCWFKYKAV